MAEVPPPEKARARPARTPIQKSPPAAESAALRPFHFAASSRLSCKSLLILAVAFTKVRTGPFSGALLIFAKADSLGGAGMLLCKYPFGSRCVVGFQVRS